MNRKVVTKIFLNAGWAFIKNRFLNRISLLLNTNLCQAPVSIDIQLTLHCNLKCQQCPKWTMSSNEELSTEEWKRIILDIKNYIGPCFFRFFGGEPFCRNDFLELVNFCSKNGIATYIVTNGTLIDEPIAKELLRDQIATINISLDGFKSETHDRLRGVIGTHQKALRAIELLKDRLPIRIYTTIMQDNLDEILSLTEFAYKNRIQISFEGLINYKIIDNICMRHFCDSDNYLFPKDLRKLDYVIEELCQNRKYNKTIVNSYSQLIRLKNYYHHSLGFKKKYCELLYNRRLGIEYKGDVFICWLLEPIGNLTKNSIKDIWKSKEIIRKFQEMKKCSINECLALRGYYREGYMSILSQYLKFLLS